MNLKDRSIRSTWIGSGLLIAALLAATPASAQNSASQSPAATPASPQDKDESDETAAPPRFLESVTISVTLNPATVRDTPGTVSVIDDGTIERRMIDNTADLVKFEPGVYVESNVTRIGLNGFNIRGIGGNRVMTQVDGVGTSEQFDFGPFNVHQFTLDLDTLKSAEIMRSAGSALYRQRRARRRGLVLHQGSVRLSRRAQVPLRRQDDVRRPLA
ncbi:MAG: TonB-dependent receptor plug domain-containing protein [Vicinamibacterales bacterium]